MPPSLAAGQRFLPLHGLCSRANDKASEARTRHPLRGEIIALSKRLLRRKDGEVLGKRGGEGGEGEGGGGEGRRD